MCIKTYAVCTTLTFDIVPSNENRVENQACYYIDNYGSLTADACTHAYLTSTVPLRNVTNRCMLDNNDVRSKS